MTLPQISRRGKEYLKTARTLLRTAETMTDWAVAKSSSRPLPTTTSGELRKLRTLMRPKHSPVRLPAPKASGHDLMGSFTARAGLGKVSVINWNPYTRAREHTPLKVRVERR